MQATQTIAAGEGDRNISTKSSVSSLMHRLVAARERTSLLMSDLDEDQLMGPRLSIVNPPLWELAHLAWFQEYWCLRNRGDKAPVPSMVANADALYNSALVPHDTRWDLPLLPIDQVRRYLKNVLDRVLERLDGAPDDSALRYFAELTAAHEEMHCEAFTYTRQTLAYRAPRSMVSALVSDEAPCRGDVAVPGGTYMLGARRSGDFVFDNEKWEHPVTLQPFYISRSAVTNREFCEFVEDGGYQRRELWTSEGWRWRESTTANAPVYWQKNGNGWLQRRYDTLGPLPMDKSIIHVNWYEADAWCTWAHRRLPSAAEWEQTAATTPAHPQGDAGKRLYPWGDTAPLPDRTNLYGACNEVAAACAFATGDSAWGCRQMMGNVWEWTADWFSPYPAFTRDPYKEYSEPWFGDHKELRGGCFATSPALMRNTWRNFYTPDRRDVFAGFRTCAT